MKSVKSVILLFCLGIAFISTGDILIRNDSKRIQEFEEGWAKVFVLYFPQYHEDELNNRLWGKGFTDWDNVKQSPQKNRYNQTIIHPRSLDIGYYDLLQGNIREYQGELANKYQIDGFLYHHHWFYNPQDTTMPPLSQSLEKLLLDGYPNITFALHWATDNWIGSWNARGKKGELLMEQHFPYNNATAIYEHYQYVKQFFHHRNYYKINDIPVFFIYPRIKKPLSQLLHQLARLACNDGFPSPGLYFIGSVNTMSSHELYTGKLSFSYQHPGLYGELFYPFATFPNHPSEIPQSCIDQYHQKDEEQGEEKRSDSHAARNRHHLNHKKQHRNHYVSILTTFDNTPRRLLEDADIYNRSFAPFFNPYQSFAYDLKNILYYEKCCQNPVSKNRDGRFVVVNAWNEWAEGMAIEPSEEHGEEWLKRIHQVKNYLQEKTCDDYEEIDNYFRKSKQ